MLFLSTIIIGLASTETDRLLNNDTMAQRRTRRTVNYGIDQCVGGEIVDKMLYSLNVGF